ncbi:lysoplasmalogenase [Arthrobacter sp.]|uniref:lysoplasmalogenase n=1 Tax=Arthrobacter sp. TaxID=1667 RepID=UPI00289B7CF5|nr:lysoplasmalogenase [Arthrobacter sp.]
MALASAPDQTVSLSRNWWWGFVPFAALSVVHVGARLVEADAVAGPTKLVLMPLLAAAAVWALRGQRWKTPAVLLLAALFFSWIGDGAGAFLPFLPELPVMLAAFGVAHLFYISLLWKYAARGPFPRWALAFPLWWLLMLVVLLPTLGTLTVAVALYGIVLGGTAATAARCTPIIAVGGVLFLASDTVLALRIFTPEAMPGWTSALVMLLYCAGQGLIVAGFLRMERRV